MTGVGQWLEDLGLGRYAEVFAASDIDFDILTDLSDADLAQLGVSLGDRKRLLRGIAVFRAGGAVAGFRAAIARSRRLRSPSESPSPARSSSVRSGRTSKSMSLPAKTSV